MTVHMSDLNECIGAYNDYFFSLAGFVGESYQRDLSEYSRDNIYRMIICVNGLASHIATFDHPKDTALGRDISNLQQRQARIISISNQVINKSFLLRNLPPNAVLLLTNYNIDLSRESVMAIVRVGQNFDFEECYPKTYQIKPIFPSDIQWSSLIIGNDVSVRSAMGRFPLPETTRFHVLVDAPLNNPLDVHSRERQSNPTYRLEDAIKACALGPVIDQDYCIRRSAVIAYLGKSLINDLIMIILGYDDAEEPFGSSKLQKDPYTIKLWNFSDRKVKF